MFQSGNKESKGNVVMVKLGLVVSSIKKSVTYNNTHDYIDLQCTGTVQYTACSKVLAYLTFQYSGALQHPGCSGSTYKSGTYSSGWYQGRSVQPS